MNFDDLKAELAHGGHSSNGTGPERDPTTWRPVDLTAALAGEDIPPPDLLHRTDKVPLLYRGKTHWFQGESESCKTWAAGLAACEVLTGGGDVLWIDFEDDDRTIVNRLRGLGASPDAIRGHLTYVRPDEPLGDARARVSPAEMDLRDLLAARTFDLAVVDGVTEAMLTEGLELKDNSDIAAFMRRLPRRLADTGAAVVAIDHVTKDRESQGRYALGGQHKLAGLTGAAYRFDVVRPFARPAGAEPSNGVVTITVKKDRPGYVRARATSERVGTLTLAAYPDGGISAAVEPPDKDPAPDTGLCRRIVDHLLVYEGATLRSIEGAVEGKTPSIRAALKWMTEPPQGWVRVEKRGQAHQHYLTDEGRGVFDDQ